MAGITVAVAALVVVMSVFNGFHALISERLNVLDPPLLVEPVEGKTFKEAEEICARLEALPEVTSAWPVVAERALAVINERQAPVKVYGVPKQMYQPFDSLAIAGNPWDEYYPGVSSAVVSVGVANTLLAPIGTEQLLGLYVPRRKGRINPANPMSAFRSDSVAISAAFALNHPEYDKDAIFVPLELARNLLQYNNNEATAIHVSPVTAQKAVEKELGDQARVITAERQHAGSYQIVNMEKWMTFLLLGFILVIASFNVISSLSLLVIEKAENARILSALGATRGRIRWIYMLVGGLITACGAVPGLLIGMLLSLGQEKYGWVKLQGDSSQLSVDAYPVDFHASDLLPIIILVAIIGAVTGLIATSRLKRD